MAMVGILACMVAALAGAVAQPLWAAELVTERMTFPKALSGRYGPRQDLPEWMRVPRWCTTDSPPWGEGQTAALLNGYADRGANVVRFGMFWGGLSHYPSGFAPHSPKLRPEVDPLAEAITTVRQRGMRLLAYLNPNACYAQSPLYETASLRDETGGPWEVRAYGIEGTRYACSNHPAFADFYTKAIRELVRAYKVDGIYVDGLTPHVCYCEHCKRKFREDTGRDLPAGLTSLGPLSVLWEMTSDWHLVGEVGNPDHERYSRWLMKCMTDLTRLFTDAARAARGDAVVVYHTWPKPDTLPHYDGTLNEIYTSKPWHFTLWKRAEFSNWGDVFEVPSLVNIYLRQEPWQGERRTIPGDVEARHLYWQALANGAYPNAWAYPGMEEPFRVMKEHSDCFDFVTTFPTRFLALPRPMFLDAPHRKIQAEVQLPLEPGATARLRLLEREPGSKVDLLCLRADGGAPTDEEYQRYAGGPGRPEVIFLPARSFDAERSITSTATRRWTVNQDAAALSGAHVVASGAGDLKRAEMPLDYGLPPIVAGGPWTLWARVVFPTVGSDSVYWQISNDDGATWFPAAPRDECAIGWEQSTEYTWVRARANPGAGGQDRVDRFLSPPAGMFAGLLHAGVPVKEMHPNHLTRQSLDGFRVLVLANEMCLSEGQCELVRDFVRRGGGLLATHETSLYDLEARRRADFGLADVFGASLQGSVPFVEGQTVEPVPDAEHPSLPIRTALATHEPHLRVRPQGASVLAWLTGPGVAPKEVPAVLANESGEGRVVYLPGRLDSSYAAWGDRGFAEFLRGLVTWVCRSEFPALAQSTRGIVGATCYDQPARRRRLVHLVNYSADWVDPFESLPPATGVRVQFSVPAGMRCDSVSAVRSGQLLTPTRGADHGEVVLPALEEYEILVLQWKSP